MANQPGFFEQLTGSTANEDAVEAAQKGQGFQGDKWMSMGYELGSNMGQGLAVFGNEVKGKFTGKKEWGGGKDAQDFFTAQANGITTEELRARRRIRSELTGFDMDSPRGRIDYAKAAAKIYNQEGSGEGVGRSLQMIKQLEIEELEFGKLEATTKEAKDSAEITGLDTAFESDGTPVTGIKQVGPDGLSGMLVEENGKAVHRPFKDGFSLHDTSKGKARPAGHELAGILKINNGTAFISKIKGLATSADSALTKTDRVLSTLNDLFENGGVESVIGSSGGFITGMDNLSRNVRGVLKPFVNAVSGADQKPGLVRIYDPETKRYTEQERTFTPTKKGWKTMAADAANSFSEIIMLPEGVERTSAAAQQHRAAVMEMAYMAARLAEPSNRGLSDNDIKAALARIAGNTSNPQTMMRRFLEMQVDAYKELDYMLSTVHGSLGEEVSNDEINTALLGEGYDAYNDRRSAMFKKFGVSEGADGRVTFEEGRSIDADVQPGEGTGAQGIGLEEATSIDNMPDEEVTDLF